MILKSPLGTIDDSNNIVDLFLIVCIINKSFIRYVQRWLYHNKILQVICYKHR